MLEDADTDNVVVFKKISSVEKRNKYLISYCYHDNKIKALHIMVPKTCAYIKSNDGQTK